MQQDPRSAFKKISMSMGDLQDPIDGGTLVPYVWPYFLVIFTYIGLIIIALYMVGTSILGS
jgi:hypothetical protein